MSEIDVNTITALERRYSDAYATARVVDGFGGTVKAVGFAFAALGLLVGFLLGSQGTAGFILAVAAAAVAIGIAILIYIFGTLISAQGQILKATLDTAVNSSPLLPDQSRIRIMSLPVARAGAGGVHQQQIESSWRCASCNTKNDGAQPRCGSCGEERVA